MSKEEILEYVYRNCEIPQEAQEYLDDIEFVVQMLEKEPSIMMDLPQDIQKKVLLKDSKYIKDVFDVAEILADEKFAKELVDKDNDVLLSLRGASVKSDYINNLIIAYIKGDKEPEYGSKLYKRMLIDPMILYSFGTKEVQQNQDIIEYMLDIDIGYLSRVKNKDIIQNKNEYLIKYLIKQPWRFEEYFDEIKDIMTPEVVESVLKCNFQNYKLINKDNPLMEQFYKSIDRIKEIRPELKMDNPNLRYELLMDSDFINMDINIINSLLEYNTGNVDKVIQIKNDGKLDCLLKFIEQYNGLYGNNLENIQNAIISFEKIQDLLVNTNNFEGILLDDSKLKTLIATENKFGINTLDDLQNYDIKVKEYYLEKIEQSSSLDEVKQIYMEMLFNSSTQNFEKFYKEYCNNSIEELQKYAQENNIDSPISDEIKKRNELFLKIQNIENIDVLKTFFENIPLTTCDIEEAKKEISKMYSQVYKSEMLDLNDTSLEHADYDGVDVIKLNGQSFNICIHRIFNFDFNMNNITNEIINNPKQWNLTEGSSTISTTLITDKKIAALFRPLQKDSSTPMIKFDTEEEAEKFKRNAIEKSTQIYEGERLTEIDENAVFYGFTDMATNGIIKMDSSDMMVEHGKGHLETNSSNCRIRASEDLSYWTEPDYWNEVVQKRKETDIDKAIELRNQNGTDRTLPSCIVCFDNNINEQSLLAAKTHKIPILMIDRQLYLDLNKQKLELARKDFSNSLSPEAMKEIFYRQPYYKIAQEMPTIIDIIKNNQEATTENKRIGLEYLAYLGQHFIEQSSGYIIDVPVEEYNKQIKKYIQSIDLESQGHDSLVTMEDMQNSYKEISALDRKNRYEQLKNDIKREKLKESEKTI